MCNRFGGALAIFETSHRLVACWCLFDSLRLPWQSLLHQAVYIVPCPFTTAYFSEKVQCFNAVELRILMCVLLSSCGTGIGAMAFSALRFRWPGLIAFFTELLLVIGRGLDGFGLARGITDGLATY